MAEEKFFYKEALTHGWQMTRKYWKTILAIAVIYFLFSAVRGTLEHFAGSDVISRREVNNLYSDRAGRDRFFQYLQEAGYINKFGHVQDKLQQMAAPEDLTLPSEFVDHRDAVYKFLNSFRYRLPFSKPVYYLFAISLWVIYILMSIGFIKVSLMLSRDQKPPISELFLNWNAFIPYVLGCICYGLTVLGGFILLIIPGIIFMIMFQMSPFLIVDKGLGPIAALKRSRAITKGSKGRLAVFGLLVLLLNLGGLLCLLVGLFFTVAITYIAMAYIYDRLENAPAVGG